MKTIYEVLLQVKADYLLSPYVGKAGLCAATTKENQSIFFEYWHKYADSLHYQFFDFTGEPTYSTDQFGWKVEDVDARIDWLNTHIKLNKP